MISRISNLKQVWQTVIGLEIHAQINSKTKLFSVAKNNFNLAPNSQVSLFDMAIPGTLPIINGRCVELALVTAVALKCDIDQASEFDRKHYFYSDMPAGYQITQHRRPIARNGNLKFLWSMPSTDKCPEILRESIINITQMHIEQDSGKSLHDYENNTSFIDLNRAGVGLLEIVTEPQFTNEFEAFGFVKELRDILIEFGVCSGHMEQGALRVDANVSVKSIDCDQMGERTEIKNIGTMKGVLKAIEFESRRQIEVLESGGKITNETRFFNPETETTVSMRDKEVIQDYRYYPEPNLPPLRLREHCLLDNGRCSHSYVCIQCARNHLLNYSYPAEQRHTLTSKYTMSLDHTKVILREPDLYQWLESVSQLAPSDTKPEIISRWLQILGQTTVTIFIHELRSRSLSVKSCPISREYFAEYITIFVNKITTRPKVLQILTIMFDFPTKSPKLIVKENKWDRITDASVIEHIVRDFVKRHPVRVQDYKSKSRSVADFFKKSIKKENDNLLDSKTLDSMVDRILLEGI